MMCGCDGRWNGGDGSLKSVFEPLDAAIKQLLAPNRPGGHQGNSKQNNDVKCTHFAGRFDGRGGAPVRYRTHRPMEEVQGFPKSH